MGFGPMPGLGDIDAMVYGDDGDDEDLEAELAALSGESPAPKKGKPKRRGTKFCKLFCVFISYHMHFSYEISSN